MIFPGFYWILNRFQPFFNDFCPGFYWILSRFQPFFNEFPSFLLDFEAFSAVFQ